MTNPAAPGADERRMQHILKERGVGPDALPPMPAERPRDWLDDLLDSNTPAPAPAEEAVEPEAGHQPAKPEAPAKPKKPQTGKARKARKRKRQRAKRHNPDTPRSAWDNKPSNPRQSLLDAWAAIPYRMKWLVCHLTAAAAGWRIGLVDWGTNTGAWFAAGHQTSSSACVLYVLAGLLVALYRMARKWAWPVRLVASTPIASITVGLLLYGAGYHR